MKSIKLLRVDKNYENAYMHITFIVLIVFVPTFETKVTEYLCSGWVFFLQTNFGFLTSHF